MDNIIRRDTVGCLKLRETLKVPILKKRKRCIWGTLHGNVLPQRLCDASAEVPCRQPSFALLVFHEPEGRSRQLEGNQVFLHHPTPKLDLGGSLWIFSAQRFDESFATRSSLHALRKHAMASLLIVS